MAKTNELTGLALDWAIAKCEGGAGLCTTPWRTWWIKIDGEERALSKGWAQSFNPSTDWSQGGPIIERESIHTYTVFAPHGPSWCADVRDSKGNIKHWKHGPTALIAAMRCYVASKLGDEVDVPKELL